MNYKRLSLSLFLLLLSTNVRLNAQTCGFGCLGLSGFYGGYSYQFYDPSTLNDHLATLLNNMSITNEKLTFKQGEGFRVGANIFRADFNSYFITAKGFFQFVKENKELPETDEQGNSIFSSTLELNHWGFGLDLGIPLNRFMDWKIVEGGVTFYTAQLSNKININTQNTVEQDFKNIDVNVGYYLGTGLIIQIVRDYISLEGTAVYNKVSISDLIDDNGNYFMGDEQNAKLFDKGNISAVLQINIGVPL